MTMREWLGVAAARRYALLLSVIVSFRADIAQGKGRSFGLWWVYGVAWCGGRGFIPVSIQAIISI
ncbi:hypothetical protein NTG1052_180039 [Candidatus Nitrotoga sp. 1052]|nr:hypothetical protein NTG1052_180039 [Candidatus Nitrotoga sp. 1052]